MFVRFEIDVINLRNVEVITFEENNIFLGMTSGNPIYLDLKHFEKLERALSNYNQEGELEHD